MAATRILALRVALATGLAAGGVGAAVALQPVNLPTPAVSLSTLTMPTRDSVAVVISYTSRCSTGGVCPTQWRVAAVAGGDKFGHVRTTLRDTLRLEKPVCPATLTVTAAVIAERLTPTVISSRGGVATPLVIGCRARTAAETAYLDSFPDANRKIVMASNWLHKTDAPSDSLYVPQPTPGEVTVPQGYTFTLCHLRRNRYTGKVNADASDPGLVCEAARKAFESERSA